jgi:hypothetical protein
LIVAGIILNKYIQVLNHEYDESFTPLIKEIAFMRMIFFVILFLFCQSLYSQINANDVISKSEQFYNNKNSGYITIKSAFKSSIAESFTDLIFNIEYCKATREITISYPQVKSISFLSNKENYAINLTAGTVIDYSGSKIAKRGFNTNVKQYPFYYDGIFKTMLDQNLKVEEKNGLYHLFTSGFDYFFDTSSFSLKSFKGIDISKYGIQVKTWEVLDEKYSSDCFHDLSDTVKSCLATYTFKKVNKLQASVGSELKGKVFGIYLNLSSIKPVNFDSITLISPQDSFLLIDIFFQSCLPCIESFPHLKNLYEKYSGTHKLMVIGLDPNTNDSVTMMRFLKRYGIAYPVAVGSNIQGAIKNIKGSILYPTYLIINRQGIVVSVQEGYSDKYFEKVVEYLINKNM